MIVDILNELDARGRRSNATVGGYITRMLSKPPIFTTEELSPDGIFVEVKLIYARFRDSSVGLTMGKVVAFVPDDIAIQDFHEFNGNLTLQGLDYSRLVTLMSFKKSSDGDKWIVKPVKTRDIDMKRLPPYIQDEVFEYSDNPIGYESDKVKHLLPCVSETGDSRKVIYIPHNKSGNMPNYPIPAKSKREFEEISNFEIDLEYEIVREALGYRVIVVNLTSFVLKDKLLEYICWLVDDNIEVVEDVSEVLDEDKRYLLLSNHRIEGYPYIEFRQVLL